jgi:hypothetical protein
MLDHIGNRQRLCVRRVCARIITRITTAPSCSTRTAITSKRSATFPRSSAQQHGARAPRPRTRAHQGCNISFCARQFSSSAT